MLSKPRKARFLGQARKRAIVFCLVLALSLFVAIPAVQNVHASTPLMFIQTGGDTTCSPTCHLTIAGGTPQSVQSGDLLIVQDNFDNCAAATFSSSPSETWVDTQAFGDYRTITAVAHSTAAYTFTCTNAPGSSFGVFYVSQFRGTFNGFGAAVLNTPSGAASGSDTANMNVGIGSLIYEAFMAYNNNVAPSNCPTVSQSSGQTLRANACSPQTNAITSAVYTSGLTVGAGAIALTASWSGCTGGSSTFCQIVRHSTLELTGPAPSATGVNVVSACYGNCGNPPISIVNTNATHTVAFNQSLTLFYEFQAQASGYFVNVTTTLGKSYLNGQLVTLGIYSVGSCPANQQPFTAPCPGVLITSLTSNTNPAKGRFSESGLQILASAGQWYGIAVSGLYSGLDLNQTNASCGTLGGGFCANPPGMQQVTGSMPTIIASSVSPSQASISNTALWAWLTSAIVPGLPPPVTPTGGCTNNFAQLDCWLPALVNNFCNAQTLACLRGSAFFWAIILTFITVFALLYIIVTLAPGVNPRALGIGELAIVVFIGWIVTMTGLGLIDAFLLVLIFFIVSWLFIGKVQGRGPI